MVSSSRAHSAGLHQDLGPPPAGRIRFVPLGGVGEIGKNLSLLEVGEDVLVIDVGLAFPEPDALGIDVVLPDISFLRTRMSRVRAIFLTHGHEDHIGALPFYLAELDVPVYGTAMTIELLRNKLERRGYAGRSRLHQVEIGSVTAAGAMSVELLRLTHSVPGSCALAIHTSSGTVVHTGDFKLDPSPVGAEPPDLARIAEIGSAGVELLLSDSTNADRPGLTPSETSVRPALRRVLQESPGRVIVVTFASNLARVRQTLELAQESGRRCCLVGRSLMRNAETAARLGYFRFSEGLFIAPRALAGTAPEQLCLIATGSQGEPLAALARIAAGSHPFIRLRPDDTVVLAANPIPGNESTVARVVNGLVARGVRVLAGSAAGVHASGHGSAEELSFMLQLLRPKEFVPVHGEPRHLAAHAELARRAGIPAERVAVLENGQAVEVGGGKARIVARVPVGSIAVEASFWDGLARPAPVPAEGEEGELVVVSLTMDRALKQVSSGPNAVLSGGRSGERDRLLELGQERVRRSILNRRRGFLDVAEVRQLAARAMTAELARSGPWRPRVLAVVTLV